MVCYFIEDGRYYLSTKEGMSFISVEMFLCMENQYKVMGYKEEKTESLVFFFPPDTLTKKIVTSWHKWVEKKLA